MATIPHALAKICAITLVILVPLGYSELRAVPFIFVRVDPVVVPVLFFVLFVTRSAYGSPSFGQVCSGECWSRRPKLVFSRLHVPSRAHDA
jgi:hypothetical protein